MSTDRPGRPNRPARRDLGSVWAIVPLRGLATAKTRLSPSLDDAERRALVIAMAARTLTATRDATRLSGTVLVTMDEAAARLATGFGARAVVQRLPGLNAAIAEGVALARERGATATLVLPIDLAAVEAGLLDEVAAAADTVAGGRPVVVVVPDRHGTGTNALLVAPARTIEPAFGPDSRAAHRAAAEAAGAVLLELGGSLTLDVDTPADLLAVEADG